jgi:hypothetical protein
MLSDSTYKKYMARKNEAEALYSQSKKKNLEYHKSKVEAVAEETKRPTGSFIYEPHPCDLPDPWETPIGTIWECHGYRNGRLCYDQWIVAYNRGTRYWELFKRNI